MADGVLTRRVVDISPVDVKERNAGAPAHALGNGLPATPLVLVGQGIIILRRQI